MADKQPLSQIDGNANSAPQMDPLTVHPKPAPSFAWESEQERALHSRIKDQQKSGKQTGAYVSPSDNILSPASAKLNAFKEKRFTKSVKPRTLFPRPTETSPLSQSSRAQQRNDDQAASHSERR